MTTTKSFSERSRFWAIYRSALKRQIPFAIITGILFCVLIPLIYWVNFRSHIEAGYTVYEEIVRYYTVREAFRYGIYMADGHSAVILFLLILLTIIIALVQNAYMHSKKTVDLYHSLPIRRPSLMGAGMLSSLTAILAPFFVVYLITFLTQVVPYGRYISSMSAYFGYMGSDWIHILLAVAVTYLFTTFVAVNVGTVFDNLVLTFVLGFTPLGVYAVCIAVWGALTYGADPGFEIALLLSPFTFAFQRYLGSEPGTGIPAPAYLIIWLAIGCVLFFAAVACYNRRKSELAEMPQPAGVFQTIAKCLVAFCGGALFLAIFFNFGPAGWIVAILAGSLVIGLIAELILSRGVRSVKKNLKWLLGAGVLCCLVALVSHYDLLGYTARVPEPDAVESVALSYRGRFEQLSDTDLFQLYKEGYPGYGTVRLTRPESIAVVTGTHRAAVENRPPHPGRYGYEGDEYTYEWLALDYKLKNGKTMKRVLNLIDADAYLQLVNLEDQEDFIRENHTLFYEAPEGEADAYTVQNLTLYGAYGQDGTPYRLPDGDTERLLNAMRQDMLSEPLEEIKDPSAPAAGYVQINYRYRDERDPNSGYSFGASTVVVGAHYANTIAALRDLGLLEEMAAGQDIDAIRFFPSTSRYGRTNRVLPLPPGAAYGPDMQYEYDSEFYVETSNPSVIRTLLGKGRNQMLSKGNSPSEYDVILMAYYKENAYVGAQLVHYNELPDDVKEQLLQY